MILTKKVKIKITYANMVHFFSLGYKNIESGDQIYVPVAFLTDGSNIPILCRCDSCGIDKKIVYKNYINYKKDKWGDYHCRKCSDTKRIDTLMKNYGVNSPLSDPEINERYKSTLKENYGVDNAKKIKKSNI